MHILGRIFQFAAILIGASVAIVYFVACDNFVEAISPPGDPPCLSLVIDYHPAIGMLAEGPAAPELTNEICEEHSESEGVRWTVFADGGAISAEFVPTQSWVRTETQPALPPDTPVDDTFCRTRRMLFNSDFLALGLVGTITDFQVKHEVQNGNWSVICEEMEFECPSESLMEGRSRARKGETTCFQDPP